MTVGELIKELSKHDRSKTIYMSSDEEGNEIQGIDEINIGADDFNNPILVIWPSSELLQ